MPVALGFRTSDDAVLHHHFELSAARSEQSDHIALEDGGVEEAAQHSERWPVLDLITHARPDAVPFKPVRVLPCGERAVLHPVHEGVRPIERDDL